MDDRPATLHRAFEDAFNRQDLESVVALYEPGAVLVSPSGSVQGTDAIRDRYRVILAARPSMQLQTLSVNRTGNLAMLHGRWTVVERGTDGHQVRREGRNTEVVRRQADGRWLFVIDNPWT
jgi:uncharacterized protein (TIGR02246 family)